MVRAADHQQGNPIPAPQISRLEAIGQKAKTNEMRPLIDLQVAIACAMQAIAEDQKHNADQSAAYLKTAQALARSLGWPDDTDLKAVAESQIGHTHVRPAGSK